MSLLRSCLDEGCQNTLHDVFINRHIRVIARREAKLEESGLEKDVDSRSEYWSPSV
jgi:hypothetical protein